MPESAQSLDRLGRGGYMTEISAEILFQSFLQEAIVSSSGMGRNVHSLMMSIQHFLCRPRRRPRVSIYPACHLERLTAVPLDGAVYVCVSRSLSLCAHFFSLLLSPVPYFDNNSVTMTPLSSDGGAGPLRSPLTADSFKQRQLQR